MVDKVEILNHVDLGSLVDIKVIQTIPGYYQVLVEPYDKTKNVVFDTKSLETLNNKITERCRGMDNRDPKVKRYIEEFVCKMLSELYKNGLVVLEEAKESREDPYSDLRKQYNN